MVRGFVSGLVWGGVIASAGLAVISQIAPLPQTAANAPTAPEIAAPEIAAPESVAPDSAVPDSGVPDSADPESAAPDAAGAEAPVKEQDAAGPVVQAPATEAAPEAALAEAGAEPAAGPQPEMETAPASVDPTAPDAPQAPDAPDAAPDAMLSADTAPEAPAVPAASDLTVAADPLPPQVDLPPPPVEEDALLAPVPDAAEPAPEKPATEPAATADAVPRAPLPQVGIEPAPAPEVEAGMAAPQPETEAPSDADASALPGTVAGTMPDADPSVATDRLPRIGAAEPLPDVAVIAEDAAPLRPIEAFARPFENPDNKPLFAILLADDGSAGLDRQTLAALPFPVTFVIDPLSPNAAEAAMIYRAGLKEVVFAASGLPQGATPADIEQAFQAFALALPETVAVIDLPDAGFQNDRTLSGAVLPILAEQGRGLLTYDRGLNAADQIARRDGLPSAKIFRRLDAEGESIPTMRRYLDRAAFRAAQEGEVVVIGTTRPETVAALLEWTVEGRAASVALAPVTAVLSRP